MAGIDLPWETEGWEHAFPVSGDNMNHPTSGQSIPGHSAAVRPPGDGLPNQTHGQIDAAHARSMSYGLESGMDPDFSTVARGELSSALEESRFLFQHAEPVMETLYDQIMNTHSMVLLTSSRGMVLHSLGDTDFVEKAARVALIPGADWSEEQKGTNAVGTALAEQEALTVHGSQHFLSANQFLTCSCAPIFDPHGQVIGALDVTGDHRSYHHHTLALVRMSAQMIENHMFGDVFQNAVRIHFHARPEFMGTLVEGIAVFFSGGPLSVSQPQRAVSIGAAAQCLAGTHVFVVVRAVHLHHARCLAQQPGSPCSGRAAQRRDRVVQGQLQGPGRLGPAPRRALHGGIHPPNASQVAALARVRLLPPHLRPRRRHRPVAKATFQPCNFWTPETLKSRWWSKSCARSQGATSPS
jgi:hypothetical protein